MSDYDYGSSVAVNRFEWLTQSEEAITKHLHAPNKCYPTGAAGVKVTANSTAWTLGSFVEIVPANTITDEFDIHYIHIEEADRATIYELVLYAVSTEIGRCRFAVAGTPANVIIPDVPFMTEIIPANTQIRAKVMTSSSSADECVLSLQYHLY